MADRVFRAGDRIQDRFELTKPLGKGSFGVVWRAVDQSTSSDVAIKFLFDKHRRNTKMLGRFVQEAKILEKLDHPNIASPIAWSADGDDTFLAMEFIDGLTLDRRFEGTSRNGETIPAAGIAWMCDQICTAVSFAHEHNVIHRDMKPKNVMVNRTGAPSMLKVLDFGIAKMLVGSEIDPTTAGRVLGSVLYIAPEQVMSRPLDRRADMFSIATIMFELITMRRTWARGDDGLPHPFHVPIAGGELNSHVAVLKRIAREGRPSAVAFRPDLSPAVDIVLHKSMSINPDDRYDTLLDFAVALRGALTIGNVEDTSIPTLVEGEPGPCVPAEIAFDELATETEGTEAEPFAVEISIPRLDSGAPLPTLRRGPPMLPLVVGGIIAAAIVLWLLLA